MNLYIRRSCSIWTVAWVLLISDVAIGGTIVRFDTSRGNIDFRLYETATPLHASNLLAYVNSDRYDGTFVHRSAKTQFGNDFVIQGGGFKILTSLFDSPIESGWTEVPTFANVTNEPGISNLRGTIALAKIGNDPNSGTSQWFINMGNNSFLDLPQNNEFTVFGRIVGDGMQVADEIAGLGRVKARIVTTDENNDPIVYNGAFTEVPVNDVNQVVSVQGDVFNSDVVLINDAYVLDIPDGDYNFDGLTDRDDLTLWENHFGSTLNAEADDNGNGIVDGADFLAWQRNFGAATALAASAVPEPSTIVLASLGLLAFFYRR